MPEEIDVGGVVATVSLDSSKAAATQKETTASKVSTMALDTGVTALRAVTSAAGGTVSQLGYLGTELITLKRNMQSAATTGGAMASVFSFGVMAAITLVSAGISKLKEIEEKRQQTFETDVENLEEYSEQLYILKQNMDVINDNASTTEQLTQARNKLSSTFDRTIYEGFAERYDKSWSLKFGELFGYDGFSPDEQIKDYEKAIENFEKRASAYLELNFEIRNSNGELIKTWDDLTAAEETVANSLKTGSDHMAFLSRFYNSKNGDRTYDAADWVDYFANFVSGGVFVQPADCCQVKADGGMRVKVSQGKLWINGYYSVNTSDYVLTLPAAEAKPRYDRVAARLDLVKRTTYLYALVQSNYNSIQALSKQLKDDVTNKQYHLGIENGVLYYEEGAAAVEGGITALSSDKNYIHNQTAASALWTVTHNLGKYCSVTVVDSGGNIIVGNVEYVNTSKLLIHFSAAVSGRAYCN